MQDTLSIDAIFVLFSFGVVCAPKVRLAVRCCGFVVRILRGARFPKLPRVRCGNFQSKHERGLRPTCPIATGANAIASAEANFTLDELLPNSASMFQSTARKLSDKVHSIISDTMEIFQQRNGNESSHTHPIWMELDTRE